MTHSTGEMRRYTKDIKPLVTILILFLLLMTRGPKLWATEIPLGEYQLRIQESIERLEKKEGRIQAEESSWFHERFPPNLVVQDSAGDGYLIDRDDFLRWIEDSADCPQGRNRFVAYQKALLKQISWESIEFFQEKANWGECRTLLDDVYRGKEFRNLTKRKTPAWKKYIKRFFEALGKWFEDHLKFLGGIQGEWILYLMYGAVLVLGGILIIWIIRSFGPVGWRWRQSRAILPPAMESAPKKGWWVWREEANKKAKQGAFREAIRFLFISVLVEGQQKGWWIYEPEATNREHLARVEGHAERREALQKLIERYELAWYGLRQPGREDFRDCEKWAQRMEASA